MCISEQLKLFEMMEISSPDALIAGVDEVGRGCLFGCVVASAVVIAKKDLSLLQKLGVTDSKKLSAKRRQELFKPIKNQVLSWQIAQATVTEIDQINILQASLLAMKRAILALEITPEIVLVDGNRPIPDLPITQQTMIKGDLRSPVIAAASILAKVWRDELMIKLAQTYPQYDLIANKGYGTKNHLLAIQKYGVSPEHRLSFQPCHQVKQNENYL
jgi:ribonuclease HII